MRPPDLTGVAKAWKVDAASFDAHAHGGVGPLWFVNGPYHPWWSWWHIGAIHLREIEGLPPPVVHAEGATHEIMCVSLNPQGVRVDGVDRPTRPDFELLEKGDVRGMPGFLTPPDFTVQFEAADDATAVAVLELVVQTVVRGQSCDSDYRSFWQAAIPATAEHYRTGVHRA